MKNPEGPQTGLMRRIDAYWSGRAREFSSTRMKEYGGRLRGLYEEVILPLVPSGAKFALDLGTGAGFFALLLAQKGLRVTGVDYSEAMLEQARCNARARGLSIEFRQMDAQALDFPDESFDFVFSRNVTWTLPRPELAYEGVARVLKRGGVFVNIDANYGRTFREADQAGEPPVHPGQTAAQLRERNDIAERLPVTDRDRPDWDVSVLEKAGLRLRALDRDLSLRLSDPDQKVIVTGAKGHVSRLFLIAMEKI